MVDVLCCISLFKQSKINIAIYFHLPMSSMRWPMVPRRVSLTMGVSCIVWAWCMFLVNVPELQKQPHEINRELKCAREELAIATNVDEPIEGDRFAAAIEVEATKREVDQVFLSDCCLSSGFHHSSRRRCRSLGTTRWRYDTSLPGSVRFLDDRSEKLLSHGLLYWSEILLYFFLSKHRRCHTLFRSCSITIRFQTCLQEVRAWREQAARAAKTS